MCFIDLMEHDNCIEIDHACSCYFSKREKHFPVLAGVEKTSRLKNCVSSPPKPGVESIVLAIMKSDCMTIAFCSVLRRSYPSSW